MVDDEPTRGMSIVEQCVQSSLKAAPSRQQGVPGLLVVSSADVFFVKRLLDYAQAPDVEY